MNRETIFLIVLMNFLAYSNGIEFQCRFNNYNWGAPVGSAYTCDYAQVSDKNNSTSLESVEGVHDTGKNNSDVKALWVQADATQMKKLPKNIDKFFPNLQVITWQLGFLNSITADDLRPFPQLKILYLRYNDIVSLDADLFQHTPRLSLVQFWSNKITNVGYDLLENLNDLVYADFRENPCINFWAQTAQQVPELKEKLRTQCSPSATTIQSTSTSTTTISTTTEESCNVRCTLNDEVDELIVENRNQRETNLVLSQAIEFLEKENDQQRETNTKNEERVLELERQIREILNNT